MKSLCKLQQEPNVFISAPYNINFNFPVSLFILMPKMSTWIEKLVSNKEKMFLLTRIYLFFKKKKRQWGLCFLETSSKNFPWLKVFHIITHLDIRYLQEYKCHFSLISTDSLDLTYSFFPSMIKVLSSQNASQNLIAVGTSLKGSFKMSYHGISTFRNVYMELKNKFYIA